MAFDAPLSCHAPSRDTLRGASSPCPAPAVPPPSRPSERPSDAAARRRGCRAHHVGLAAEDAAAAAYEARGGRVLARRVRNAGGEIDLIVGQGRWIVFAEVKRRRRRSDCPVTARNRARVTAAAGLWLAERCQPGAPPPFCRFDAVLVAADGRPTIVEQAWTGDGTGSFW